MQFFRRFPSCFSPAAVRAWLHWPRINGAGCLLLTTALAARTFAQPDHGSAPTLDLAGYKLTFEDRFATPDISAHGPGGRWTAHTPWNGDFGAAAFGDPAPDGPFSFGAGGLAITARRDAVGHWHSGLIASVDRDGAGQRGFAQRYGYSR